MRWLRWLALAAVLIGFCAWMIYAGGLYVFQDAILFPAPSTPRQAYDAQADRSGIETFTLTTDDGLTLYGWHARGRGQRALIFFHGNGGGVDAVPWFREQLGPDVDVFAVHYRGYPGSEGHPSEAGLALDARALWEHVTGTVGIPAERIVVHGQSLGGGVALMLLQDVQPAALVLDSTFLGVDRIAADRFWMAPTFLLANPFRSFERAPNVRVPALVIHGDADTLIPVAHGRGLAELLPDATYLEVEGGGHHQFLPAQPQVNPRWRAFVEHALR